MKDAWTLIVAVKADTRVDGGPISNIPSVRKKAFAPYHNEKSACHQQKRKTS